MKAKVKLYYDTRPDQPEEIGMYFHCRKCLEELPEGQSPRDYQRIQAGVMADGGLQIWCVRHDLNVAILSGSPRPGLEYPEE